MTYKKLKPEKYKYRYTQNLSVCILANSEEEAQKILDTFPSFESIWTNHLKKNKLNSRCGFDWNGDGFQVDDAVSYTCSECSTKNEPAYVEPIEQDGILVCPKCKSHKLDTF